MIQFPSRILLTLPVFALVLGGYVNAEDFSTKITHRRPVALELADDEELLLVANRRSGTISTIRLRGQEVVAELKVAQKLSDFQKIPGQNRFLATDQDQHKLLILALSGKGLQVVQRVSVERYPVSVVSSADGRRCVVASLWSRRLTFIELPASPEDRARVVGRMDMPFAPRCQLLVEDDNRLLVADSFGGRLAVVDPQQRKLLFEHEIPGHNIRGLSVSANGKMLLISHQMLNELAHTVRNDVHWGLLMSNDLRWLRLSRILDKDADIYKESHMHPLGEAGRATADPAGLDVARDGTVIVTLGGVDEIAIGKEGDFSLSRTRVGRRPTAVTTDRDVKTAYVANTFDDSISVIDLKEQEEVKRISLGPSPELTMVDRGERLFFDGRLSHDSWMSCQSCHTDGHTNGLLNDNFSDKSFGAPKRVLSLLGKADTAPFAWNASAKDFPEQIRKSIEVTMQGDRAPSDRQLAQLAAFLHTLDPPPPIDLARGERDEAAVARGRAVFESMRCNSCHAPPAYTTPKTYDVGLTDQEGNTHFNPPSLRGVGQRGPYFHDGRAKSLEDVFHDHGHKLRGSPSDRELADLIAFLRSL